MFRRATCLLASGALFLAACGDSVSAPEDQLTEEDVQFLAQDADAMISSLFDDLWATSSTGPAGAPGLAAEAVVRTSSFERSRSCRAGGTVALTGTATRTWDRDAATYDVESSGTKTRTDCAYVRGDVTVTVNGSGAWTHERHWHNRAPTGDWITTYDGEFAWEKSSGESGGCSYDLTSTVDTAANTRTLVGTYCGREINRSRTWRDA